MSAQWWITWEYWCFSDQSYGPTFSNDFPPLLVEAASTWARFIRFSHSISAILAGISPSFLLLCRFLSCELSCVAGAGTNADDYFDFICPAKGEIRATRIGLVVCMFVCLCFLCFYWLPRFSLRCGEFMRSCFICMFFLFFFPPPWWFGGEGWVNTVCLLMVLRW